MLRNDLSYYNKLSQDRKRKQRMGADSKKRGGKPYKGSYEDFEAEYYGKPKRTTSNNSQVNRSRGSRTSRRDYNSSIKWGQGLTNPVLWIVIVALFYFVQPLGKAFKKLIGFVSGEPSEEELERAQAEKEAVDQLAWTIDWSSLPKAEQDYKDIANSLFNELDSWWVNGVTCMTFLKDLTDAELNAVWVKFDVQKLRNLGGWFANQLSDTNYGGGPTELQIMRQRWTGTGRTF